MKIKMLHSWKILFVLMVTFATCVAPVRADDVEAIIKDIVRNTRSHAVAAEELLKAAGSLTDAPKTQVKLCEAAYEYGLKSPTGYASAIKALDSLDKLAPAGIDTWQKKRIVVYRLRYSRCGKRKKLQYGQPLVKLLLSEGQRSGQAHHWDDAVKLYNEASSLAWALRLDNRDEIRLRFRAAKSLKRLHERAELLEKELAKTPDDIPKRTELIHMYLINLNMPQEAAKHVNDKCDEILRTNVPLAAKSVSELKESECLQLGRWYRALVKEAPRKENKIRMLKRAQIYLGQYLKLHVKKDAIRLKVSIGLTQVAEALEKFNPSPKLPRGAIQVLTFDKAHWITKGDTVYIKDVSGRKYNAIISNPKAVKGIVGQGLELARGSFINTRIKHSSTPRTFVLWAKVKEKSKNAVLLGLADKNWANRFYFGFDENKGYLGLGLGGDQWKNESKGIMADGKWHHYALLWNGKKMLLCVDGTLKATKVGQVNSRHTYFIGACNVGNKGTYFSRGSIDEVAIFNRLLSKRELRTIIETGKKGLPLAK